MADFATLGAQHEDGFKIDDMLKFITDGTAQAKAKLDTIKNSGSDVSIGDMFDMQLLMNRLSQVSEMTTSVINAAHSAISSMARNVKG